MSTETIKRSIDSYCAGINAMNVDTILTAFAPDAIETDPVGSPPLTGQAQIRPLFEGIFNQMASMRFTAENTFGMGNDQALKWTMSGRGKNGRDFTCEGVDVMKFDDAGHIQTLTAYWDAPAVLAVLQS